MRAALGIDTGGTYTDAVIMAQESGKVLASGKAVTTHDDLCVGIRAAVSAALEAWGEPAGNDAIELVALSTTLATNAVVENRGGRACLILIGYDQELIQRNRLAQELPFVDIVRVSGGHDVQGNESAPLDEAALRAAVQARCASVEAFGISGYFGVRNPEHERRARSLVEALCRVPVTCGHELTTRLNAVQRALTVAMNARLIPLLGDLIEKVYSTLQELDIHAPLMIVKGDGSLVGSSWALRRPVETILSGPAASAMGAWHLARVRDAWVLDMGGTTTDIASLRSGRLTLNPEGARVGGRRLMIEAIDAHTAGLGGDSHVQTSGDQRLKIGPRRVVPLALLAARYPAVVRALEEEAHAKRFSDHREQFVLLHRAARAPLAPEEESLLHQLEQGPVPVSHLIASCRYGRLVLMRIEALEDKGILQRAGFTPTDALHVLGRLETWDVEAARLGASLLARAAGLEPVELCRQVVEGVSRRAARQILTKALEDAHARPQWSGEPTAGFLVDLALGAHASPALGCQLSLKAPIVAIGAPAHAFLPWVSERLHTSLTIPEHAPVAGAVGAVAGNVTQRVRVLIFALDGDAGYRAHLPTGIQDFEALEQAVREVERAMRPYVQRLALQAGAREAVVELERHDVTTPLHPRDPHPVHIRTELVFTAAGRPGMAG